MVRQGIGPKRRIEPIQARRARFEAEIQERYPDLRVLIEKGQILLRGSYPVADDGEVLDRYLVEITLPSEFPDAVPVVREISGRIPALADRHVYRNGTLCVLVPEDWLLHERRTLLSFLDGPLRNFFIGESLVARGHPRPFGERSHGLRGLFEAYGEIVGSADPLTIRRYLECLAKRQIKGHWDCPCGSGLRVRKCHRDQLRHLRERMPRSVAQSALERLRASIAAEASVTQQGK
jgi:hypothetical protein